MQLTRLYLRNYRVYEDELELPMPAGLVGIVGPNGSGKSALLESILFALWGRARTGKEDVRTADVNGECVAEVEFEHEGHLYVVRRSLAGVNHTTRAEAWSDGLQVAAGVKDVGRYLHSVLGMDDAAFRASVFAEQKQIAAFSNQTPAARRDLVLKLLGITPLDLARDAARRDAKVAQDDVARVRNLLLDLDELRPRVEQARAAADAAAADAESEATAAATARDRAAAADEAFVAVDVVRQEHEALVREGKLARAECDRARQQLDTLAAELAQLAEAERRLAPLLLEAAGLAEVEQRLALVQSVVRARRSLEAIAPSGDEPPAPEAIEADVDRAREAAEEAQRELASVTGARSAAEGELARARQLLETSAVLSEDEDCPLCGQELGDAFARVQQHRRDEVAAVEARLAELRTQEAALAERASKAVSRLRVRSDDLVRARGQRDAWLQANRDRLAAERVLEEAMAALGRDAGAGEADELAADVDRRRAAAREASRLEGMLARLPIATEAKREAEAHLDDAEGRRATLLEKVRSLGFDPAALEASRAARDDARARAARAAEAAEAARVAAERAKVAAEVEAQRLADAEAQHAALAERAEDARHLGRLSELLNAFRTNVIASIEPRLSAQARTLFDELTDHEYDELKVDPGTYEIRIKDAGREYGMDRFSGSETDLANLALRVAISEHVRFQSGGAVGLLVLDEVFGPLDGERKARMLLALERLRSRFRQILVVTHEDEIKQQLGGVIEVVKLPGRRATARVLGV
jgi:DNA repair exonuclease SbcCD ATPase subunit